MSTNITGALQVPRTFEVPDRAFKVPGRAFWELKAL